MRPRHIAAEYNTRRAGIGAMILRFNEAAAYRRGIRAAAASPVAWPPGFNEAAAYRRGIPWSDPGQPELDAEGFNEAAAYRRGILERRLTPRHGGLPGFNEAAAYRRGIQVV